MMMHILQSLFASLIVTVVFVGLPLWVYLGMTTVSLDEHIKNMEELKKRGMGNE